MQPVPLAVVFNPTKLDDITEVKRRAATLCSEAGWPEPQWYETRADDPGMGMARRAIDEGARIVCSLGGDGTVRAVAAGILAAAEGSGEDAIALGVLPAGTGNLLARNLGLPLDGREAGLRIVLEGRTRRIDVGRVTFDDGEPSAFLVAAGVGLDAETMADVEVDDGVLDVLVAAPRGVVGWAAVAVNLITRHRRGHRAVWRRQATRVEARLGNPVEGEIDGDAVGQVRRMRCTIEPGVLPVCVPGEGA